jgi:rRNA maturation RNase YbeY
LLDGDELELEVMLDADVPIPVDITHQIIAELIDHCLREEGIAGRWQFSIAFVDEPEIVELHERFMQQDSPTDILTFPYDADPGSGGGDIAICVPVATANAHEHGKTLAWELAFLVVHGVLHVLGWDDATDADRTAMLHRQTVLLAGAGFDG